MILGIGAVKRIGGSSVPAHAVSIEMGAVLRHFRDLTDELEVGELPFDDEKPCVAELRRGDGVIAICALSADHEGDHLEVGTAEPLDNWPPKARLRWGPDVTSFRRYDSTDEPTWKWEDDNVPPPALDWTFTGVIGAGVSACRHRYDRHSISKRIALPDLSQFTSHRRDIDPLTLFLHWVSRQLGGIPDGQVLNSARLYLVPVDHDRLIALERFWSKRLTGDPLDAWVEELNYAPLPLGSDSEVPRWAKEGFLYVATGAIRRSADRPR
jgi:hypothetical protein